MPTPTTAPRKVKLTRVAAVLAIAACGSIGIYGAIVESLRNGFFDVLHNTVGGGAVLANRYIPGAPEPLKLSYTGVAPIDRYLLGMIGFFSPFLDGERTWDVDVAYWYMMTHFCAGTGIMGLILQSVTYTVTVPVWLIVHLLTSPVAKGDPAAAAVDAADMALLPACAALAFVFPAVMMNLPSPSVVPAARHYGWIAFWNAFPLTQAVHHWILKRLVAPSASAKRMAAAAAGATAVPFAPEWMAALLTQVDLSSAFAPTLPRGGKVGGFDFAASFGGSGRRVPGDFLPPLAKIFLQWDVYSANAAMLIWAVYVYGVSRSVVTAAAGRSVGYWTSGWLVASKAVGWFMVGGPVAAATFLMWERDEAAFRVVAGGGGKKGR
ncbi:hypothetical protein B0T19DRAFT_486138 [Cercophora scortea]|uniref:Uncharacterized protein n=1 Tax=Cercophora scortea TaxID=314031 RepID=A0AAE0M9U6_9PEZI|nr:hypothetical protein B0T19DRAFT_486138 [Cercophora scortea]